MHNFTDARRTGRYIPVPSRFPSLAVLGTILPVNLQVTVLKVLVSYPDGFARFDDLERGMAFLATCGKDWSDRTKRLAARIPDLSIFSQGLVERLEGGWRITEQGRQVLAIMEAHAPAQSVTAQATE